MTNTEQKIKALDAFKDWSNYLLVTTVAALGWLAKEAPPGLLSIFAIWCFAISTILAICTLPLIPGVAENIDDSTESIYDVHGVLSQYVPNIECLKNRKPLLRHFCFWHHLTFVFRILLYAAAATCAHPLAP